MRNPIIEAELSRLGFAFEYVPGYLISRLDMTEADENPARLGAKLSVDTVVGYAMKMEEGADWSPIIVRDIGMPLDQLINGRHSIAACGMCKPERKTIDAYVIRDADPVRIDMLIRCINIPNGRQPDTAERLLHCAEMKRMHPHLTIKELAVRFSVKREKITEFMAVLDAEKRGDRLGIGHALRTRMFGVEVKKALNTLQSDKVFLQGVKLIAKYPLELRGDAGLDLVASLRNAGSELQGIKVLETRDKDLARADAERKIKKTRSPSSKATRFMGDVRRVTKSYPGSVEKLYLAGLGGWRQLRREVKVLDEAIGFQEDVRDAMIALADEMERIEQWSAPRPGKPSSAPPSTDD